MREETLVEMSNLRSEHGRAAAHHRELLTSTRRVVKALEERKVEAADSFVKLRKIYHDGRKVTREAHVSEWSDLWSEWRL